MNSFEINKYLGALLGTCLILLAVHIGSGAIFSSPAPAKPGYEVAVKEEKPGAGEAAKSADVPIETLLASASVFVLPSVVEPFGIVALEAMSAGVPTIVSKTSGVAEITAETFAVDFWDIDEFASRIVELLQYPELRSMMGQRGRWEAIRSGWAERALETVGIYGDLLSARSVAP